jgi:hypothetical protein
MRSKIVKNTFSSLANAWAPFTWENTGNRNWAIGIGTRQGKRDWN